MIITPPCQENTNVTVGNLELCSLYFNLLFVFSAMVVNKQQKWKSFHNLDGKKNFPIININFNE